MELDNFLFKVQGVLKNEQKLLGPLCLVSKENEDSITKVEASLKKVLADRSHDSGGKIHLQLYLLLLLNTDHELYSDFKKSRKYAHLVGFFPKISQELFIKLIFGLQLNHYLYESVKYVSSPLSYHLLEICLKSLKWMDLFEGISFTENLIISLFSKIVMENEKDEYYNHLKDVFQRLLLQYDAEKSGIIKRMGSWKSPKLKHYAGVVMASLLELVEQCTKIFCKKESNTDLNNRSLYNIQIGHDFVAFKSLPSLSSTSCITVQQCYEHVVARCLQNICGITVDLWLFWVEIELDHVPDTENTLQKLIGEKAYTCRDALKEAEGFSVSSKESSDLINRLKNMAMKPITEDDQVASLDLGRVLENIENPEKDTGKWLKFLLTNPFFVVNPSALEVLKGKISLLQDNDITKLSKILFEHIDSHPDSSPQKAFIFDLSKQCDIDSQMKVLQCFVETCGLTDVLKSEEFQPNFVETFNRVINEEDKEKELYPQFAALALQDAKAVVRQAVSEGITSEVRGHLMADILGKLQPACDAPLPSGNSLLIMALDELLLSLSDLPDNQKMNYPLFVRELVMRKNLNGEQFIKNCLMEKIHSHMKTKNWVVLSGCLETMSELLDMDCVLNCPATLVMLLQVVEISRCQPSNFNMAAVQVCQLALQMVPQFVSKWYNQGVEDKHLENMTTVVRHYISPLNRFHLYRLFTDEPVPADPGLQLMYRTHFGIGEWSVLSISPDERLKLVYALCFVLPVLTASEWQELFCVAAPKCSEFLALFNIVTDALLLCLDSAKAKSDNETVVSCLNYSILNIAQVVKDELNRWTKDDNEYRISVLSKLCQLMSTLPAERQETFGLSLVKLLQQLLPEGSRRKPLTAEEMNTVTTAIGSIRAIEVRQNLAKEFLEMVHR